MSIEALQELLDVLSGKGEMDVETLRKQLASLVTAAEKRLKNPERRGHELWSLCPYHDDRNVGSFSVNLNTGKFFCFVCGAKGALRSLLFHLGVPREEIQRYEAVLSPYVLKYLSEIEEEDEAEPLMEVPASVLTFFEHHSTRMLHEKKHERSLLEKMSVKYDITNSRIVFPVWDMELRLVGIQSRAAFDDDIRWKWYRSEFQHFLPDDLAYEFEVYNPPRKRVLYNEHRVLRSWMTQRKTSAVVLCEGPGHALRVMATGFPTMATFGASPSTEQFDRMKHVIRRAQRAGNPMPLFFLAYDADEAGMMAAARIAFELRNHAREIRIVELPEGLDPEDLTPKDLFSRITSATPLLAMRQPTDDPLRLSFQQAWMKAESEAHRTRRMSRRQRDLQAKKARVEYARSKYLIERTTEKTTREYVQEKRKTDDGPQ